MIEIRNLRKTFSQEIVLKDIELISPAKEIIGIAGFNGAGKTTFFNILAGYIKPDTGKILLNDSPVKRKSIKYLETNNFFYSRLTAREYLEIFPQTNPKFNLDDINQLLNLPLDDLIENYSTGMKKKAALVSILKQEAEIYIFDEPFNGLDLESNRLLEEIIKKLKSIGKTVFLSSHIMQPLRNISDRIFILDKGKISTPYLPHQFDLLESFIDKDIREKAKDISNKIF